MWSIDRRSTKILQWDASTRLLSHVFQCNLHSPVGQVISRTAEEAGVAGTGEVEGEGKESKSLKNPSIDEVTESEKSVKRLSVESAEFGENPADEKPVKRTAGDEETPSNVDKVSLKSSNIESLVTHDNATGMIVSTPG